MTTAFGFVSRDGGRMPADVETWCSEDGGVLEPVLPEFDPAAIDTGESSIWRYAAMLPPIDPKQRITLGEGGTRMIQTSLVGIPIYAKLEFMQPTGSYKDRGSAVLASALVAHDVRSAVEDSSGNAGASIAAYLARANIGLTVFVPGAVAGDVRIRQVLAYGAEVDKEATSRPDAGKRARAAVGKSTVYASHVYSPYFLAGQMTMAWEIWESMGKAPASVVVPVGNGLLLLGLHRGFQHLMRAGLIEKLPRIFGVQASVCSPVFDAFTRGAKDTFKSSNQTSIASGISIPDPPRGREILAAVRETGGTVVGVSEVEIRRGMALAANMGWFVEPASAAAVAGVVKLDKVLDDGEAVVLPLTGSGLKI